MKRGEVRRLAMMPDIQKLVEWKMACWDTTKRSWDGKVHFFECRCYGSGEVRRRREWGEESALYVASVLGRFPEQGANP